ncbi:hypothetical protein N7452_003659 [Penicillium brevicompactum]|uniref:Uncharacterized protein n=1 Tax=Penicillium brevicompactum TaxID=5074 RepID=A0A9W9UMP7_PENBR|nr:hypothetical protein N7452_003659 [Penicillium brevicompactum]
MASTVLASTVLASTVLASTVLASTVLVSTDLASTVMGILFPTLTHEERELMDKSPPGPDQEARPIPTFVGEPHDGNPITEIIHGHEGIVSLLRYVEESIGNLHEAALAENSSDEELQAARANIVAYIHWIQILLQDLEREV